MYSNKYIARVIIVIMSDNFYQYFSMPCPRRHMVAAFLKNKLLLVGGVGKYRLKLSNIDIYNIHTGENLDYTINKKE